MQARCLKIRTIGDPCLRKKSLYVKEVGSGERLLIESMILTMRDAEGIGLAAPQVGINQRIFVLDIGEGPIAVINPEVLKRSGVDVFEEGCLSVPEMTVEIKRPSKIYVCYLDENNCKAERVLEGLVAKAFLHETDHLNGKLIVDYMSLPQKIKYKKKFKELAKKRLDCEDGSVGGREK